MNTRTFNHGILFLMALIGLVTPGCSQEAKLSRHLAKANEYFASGSYEKAELEYKNVLQLSAQNQLAMKRLGIIYADQGRLARADFFLSHARRLNTNDLDVRVRLASVFLGTGRNQEARAEALYVLGRTVEYPEASQALALSANTTNLLLDTRQRLLQIQQRVGDKGHLQVALGILSLRQKDFKAAETAFQKALALDPKSVEAITGLSSVYWGLNDLAKAEQYLKQAASLTPVRSGKPLNYALFKLGTGATSEARKMLDEIARQAPDYLPAQRILASLAWSDRKFDECSRIARGILTHEPIDFEAMLLLSRIKMVQGKPSEAVAMLTRLSGLYTNSAQAYYQLGVAYLGNNEQGKALPLLRQASQIDTNLVEPILLLAQQDIRRGDTAAAIAALSQVIKRQPPVGVAYMLLADAYLAGGSRKDALAIYTNLMTLFPKDPQPAIQMGFVLLNARRTGEARKAFEKAVEIAPGSFAAQEMLVNLELVDKNFAAAMQRVKALRGKDPQGVNPMLLEGRVFLAQTNYPQAEAVLNKAIELAPESRSAYLMLADVYVVTHREQEALAKLQSGVSKNNNDWPALMMMASIQDRLKNYPEAAKAYERALASNATNLVIVNNLAYLYSEKLNQPEKAQQMIQKAQILAPENPSVADTAGWILSKRGEYARALVLLQESAEKLSADPEAQYHLAMTHYMLGEEVPAQQALERALLSKQDFPGRAESERRLAFLKLEADAVDLKTLQEWESRTAELPGNPSGDPVVLARLARRFEKNRAHDQARDVYEKWLKLNPRDATILMKLAQLNAAHLNNPKRALDLAKEARTLSPDDPEIGYFLGRLVFQDGDHPWAVNLLLQSAQQLANQPEVFYHLARAQFSVGQIAEAKTSLKSALSTGELLAYVPSARKMDELLGLYADTAPLDRSALRVQEMLKAEPGDVAALAVAARLFDRQGNQAAAKQGYEKVLALYPSFSPAIQRLAVLYAESSVDEKGAYEMAAKARKAFPMDPEVAKALGIAEYKRGGFARATQLLQESAKTRKTDGAVFFYLGMAHYRAKEKKEAADGLRLALALNLRKDLADEAKRILASLP